MSPDTGLGTDASLISTHAPTGLTFADTVTTCGEVEGFATVGKAVDESDVTSYALYWGTNATTKLYLTPIVVLPVTGSDPVYQFFRTSYPGAASYLLAFSANAVGEMPTPAAAPIDERSKWFWADIAGGKANLGLQPRLLLETANGKLLVVAYAYGKNGTPALFRCDKDGSACSYINISAGQGDFSGRTPSAVIDAASAKLLVVTQNGANQNKPGLFRCDLDGSACSYVDISAGRGANCGLTPSVVVDAPNSKLLVVTHDGSSDKPALFRCDRDGSSCAFVDISAGKAGGTGINPSAVIDAANGKLLVVGEESAGIPAHTKSSLFRCNLDGSACTYVDISVGQLDSGFRPTALVDAANGKLLVIAGTSSSGPALYRCNLDGTSCSYAILTANLGPHLGSNPSALIDVEGGKLLVVAEDSSNSSRPALYRCNLDGSSCTYTDISVGRGALSGLSPSVALDPASRKVFVATMDGRLGLPDYALSLFANCP